MPLPVPPTPSAEFTNATGAYWNFSKLAASAPARSCACSNATTIKRSRYRPLLEIFPSDAPPPNVSGCPAKCRRERYFAAIDFLLLHRGTLFLRNHQTSTKEELLQLLNDYFLLYSSTPV